MPATVFQKISVNGVGPTGVAGTQQIFAGNLDVVSSCVFQIANLAASFSTIPSIVVISESAAGALGLPPSTASINAQYINLATGAVSAAGTAITANGIYGVYCPGCAVELITSAGNADCFSQFLVGRIF